MEAAMEMTVSLLSEIQILRNWINPQSLRLKSRSCTDGDIFEDEEGQITGHKSAAHIS